MPLQFSGNLHRVNNALASWRHARARNLWLFCMNWFGFFLVYLCTFEIICDAFKKGGKLISFFSLKDRSKTHFTSMLYFLAFNTGLSQISPTCSSQFSSYFWPLAIPRIYVWLFSNFPSHFYFLTQNSFFLHWLPCLVDSTSPSSTLSVFFFFYEVPLGRNTSLKSPWNQDFFLLPSSLLLCWLLTLLLHRNTNFQPTPSKRQLLPKKCKPPQSSSFTGYARLLQLNTYSICVRRGTSSYTS